MNKINSNYKTRFKEIELLLVTESLSVYSAIQQYHENTINLIIEKLFPYELSGNYSLTIGELLGKKYLIKKISNSKLNIPENHIYKLSDINNFANTIVKHSHRSDLKNLEQSLKGSIKNSEIIKNPFFIEVIRLTNYYIKILGDPTGNENTTLKETHFQDVLNRHQKLKEQEINNKANSLKDNELKSLTKEAKLKLIQEEKELELLKVESEHFSSTFKTKLNNYSRGKEREVINNIDNVLFEKSQKYNCDLEDKVMKIEKDFDNKLDKNSKSKLNNFNDNTEAILNVVKNDFNNELDELLDSKKSELGEILNKFILNVKDSMIENNNFQIPPPQGVAELPISYTSPKRENKKNIYILSLFLIILSFVLVVLYVVPKNDSLVEPENEEVNIVEEIQTSLNSIQILNSNYITNDVTLPKMLLANSTEFIIIWSSSNETIISDKGEITRYTENKSAHLTAQVNFESTVISKEFSITVLKVDLTLFEEAVINTNKLENYSQEYYRDLTDGSRTIIREEERNENVFYQLNSVQNTYYYDLSDKDNILQYKENNGSWVSSEYQYDVIFHAIEDTAFKNLINSTEDDFIISGDTYTVNDLDTWLGNDQHNYEYIELTMDKDTKQFVEFNFKKSTTQYSNGFRIFDIGRSAITLPK